MVIFSILVCFLTVHCIVGIQTKSELPAYWNNIAATELKESLQNNRIETKAKNVIIFIGDGMSIPTVTAARILKAQLNNDDHAGFQKLSFEESPYVALSKTYTNNRIVPDSAATATAMFSGIKTNSRVVGVDSRVQYNNCTTYSPDYDVTNIFSDAANAGLATGVVTTTRVTHATPASTFGHSANRYWESDADLPKGSKCEDLASQLIRNAAKFNVFLGGGYKKFVSRDSGGDRRDGRNLINEWREIQRRSRRKAEIVRTKQELNQAAKDLNINHILGLFSPSHLPYFDEQRSDENANVPSLEEMVEQAITVLSRNKTGYVLLVESGKIDHAHHKSWARRALYEVLEMDKAYEKALKMTNPKETLMIVTADHSHTMTIGGYPSRDVSILGIPDSDTEHHGKGIAADGKRFTTLLYANGPGAPFDVPRSDPLPLMLFSPLNQWQAAVPLKKETHGGDDVAIYSRGPMAHLLTGVKEQNFIAHVMMYATCLGRYRDESECLLSAKCSILSISWLVVAVSAILGSLSIYRQAF